MHSIVAPRGGVQRRAGMSAQFFEMVVTWDRLAAPSSLQFTGFRL